MTLTWHLTSNSIHLQRGITQSSGKVIRDKICTHGTAFTSLASPASHSSVVNVSTALVLSASLQCEKVSDKFYHSETYYSWHNKCRRNNFLSLWCFRLITFEPQLMTTEPITVSAAYPSTTYLLVLYTHWKTLELCRPGMWNPSQGQVSSEQLVKACTQSKCNDWWPCNQNYAGQNPTWPEFCGPVYNSVFRVLPKVEWLV